MKVDHSTGYLDLVRNQGLLPEYLTDHQLDSQPFWWLCEQGHSWQANFKYISPKCPKCNGIKRSLLVSNPVLAKEWHPTKNGTLTPSDVYASCRSEAWWLCIKSHEWKTRIKSRNLSGSSCPYCAGKRASKENNLESINPILSTQWHPSKNKELRPMDVTPKSHKKVWWLCDKNHHEWQATITSRAAGNNCPYCASRAVCEGNCLFSINSKLSKEWHPIKNGLMTSKDVMPRSNKVVWWLCHNNHEWRASIYSRSRFSGGCKKCQDAFSN